MSTRRRPPTIPSAVVVAGLTAVVVGTFLPWQTASCCEAGEIATTGWHWPVTVIAVGVALAVIGLTRWRRGDAVVAGTALVVAGVAADWVAVRRSLFPGTLHGSRIGLSLAAGGALLALLASLPLAFVPGSDDDQDEGQGDQDDGQVADR